MVDLHSHVLPGLDDGPVNTYFSIALAQAAVAGGTEVIAATPHVRADHSFDPREIPTRVEELNLALRDMLIPLEVVPGAELSLPKAHELEDDTLRGLCLGQSRHLLVESPYGDMDDQLEMTLSDLLARGFQPVLAHPERSAAFYGRAERLAELVGGGVLSSVTAGSMAGRFGEPVRGFTLTLLELGLVHDVASDAHNHLERPPDLIGGFKAAEERMPGITAQARWYTADAPRAILHDRPLPPRPDPPSVRQGLPRWIRRGRS